MIRDVPVTLNFDYDKIIGKATIHGDGTIVMNLQGSHFTREVKDLITLDDVRHFSVGVGYRPAQKKEEIDATRSE